MIASEDSKALSHREGFPFLSTPRHIVWVVLSFDDAQKIMAEIETTSQSELLEELFKGAHRYGRIRAEFYLMNSSERREADEGRTRVHNAFIADCDILARAMEKVGESTTWRQRLGSDRKRVGDLACWIIANHGLRSR